MFDNLKARIKDKNLIIFGEIHGTKEIPELLSKFLSEIAKKEDFNLCLEIPIEFQNNIEDFFKDQKFRDGRNSAEYFNLIQNMKNLNWRYNKDIKIFCIDAGSNIPLNDEKDIQNIREKIMAENILKNLQDKKTFVVVGSFHASKNIIQFQEKIIVPMGNIIYKKLKDKMISINIMPSEGKFFNFGVKEILKNNLKNPFNKNFDYVYNIRRVTPCSFLKDSMFNNNYGIYK